MDTPFDPTVSETQVLPKRATVVRYWILFGLAFAAMNAYLSRVCLSTAATTIQAEYKFDDVTMGQILAAFSAGYFWFQLPGGWLGNRYGARKILPLICIWWSACAGWTGLAAGSASFWWSRMVSGIAQAGIVPVSAKAVLDWFPQHQRGVASSMIATAMSVGAVLASGLTGQLMPVLGWRGVFFVYALIGVAWSVAFYFGFRDRPGQHPRINATELKLITSGQESVLKPAEQKAEPEKAPEAGPVWQAMLTSSSMWLICIQAFFRAFGAAFFITWFPAYLEQARGITKKEAAMLTMIPLMGTVLGNLAGGVLVDRLLALTGSKRISRCGTSTVALLGCAVMIAVSAWVPGALPCAVLLGIGSLFAGSGSAAAWACTMDISGKHTSIMFALMNMTGNIGALVCPLLVGYLIKEIKLGHGDWNMVLYLFVGIYILGAMAWAGLNPLRSAVSRAGA